MIVSCSTLRIRPNLYYIEKFITQFETTEKNYRSPRNSLPLLFLRGNYQPIAPRKKHTEMFSFSYILTWDMISEVNTVSLNFKIKLKEDGYK